LVSYQQLDQHGIKQVLVSSSGRPKAQSLQRDDQYFWYEYDQRGGLISKEEKFAISQYAYWHKQNVKFNEHNRITPLTEFEKRLGVSMSAKPIMDVWYNGRNFTDEQWNEFVKRPDQHHDHDNDPATPPRFDYGNAEYYYSSDLPTRQKQQREISWGAYFTKKAKQKDLIVVGSIEHLNFKEKPNPAIIDKIPTPSRPNPKEESIASVKIEPSKPVEPIKEVAKYSPLMIAGVIAVVVILLLKRRRA